MENFIIQTICVWQAFKRSFLDRVNRLTTFSASASPFRVIKISEKNTKKSTRPGMARTIHVLNAFRPYLRLLTAYKRANINDSNWRCFSRSFYNVFHTTLMIVVVPLPILLSIWYLMENDSDLMKLVTAVPLLVSMLQMVITFIAMIAKNHIIIEVIDRLQLAVNQRKIANKNSLKILISAHFWGR